MENLPIRPYFLQPAQIGNHYPILPNSIILIFGMVSVTKFSSVYVNFMIMLYNREAADITLQHTSLVGQSLNLHFI